MTELKRMGYAAMAVFIGFPGALFRHGGEFGFLFGTLYFALPMGVWLCAG